MDNRSARRYDQLRAQLSAVLRLNRLRAAGTRADRSRVRRVQKRMLRRTARQGRAAQRQTNPRQQNLVARVRAADYRLSLRSPRTAPLLPCVQGVRRTGSAALDLAYVACGRVDGFWEFGLKQWDIAAGSLIVEEAGGHVSNMDGAALDLALGQIIASNGRLHQPMIEVIESARPEAERRHAEMLREDGMPRPTASPG